MKDIEHGNWEKHTDAYLPNQSGLLSAHDISFILNTLEPNLVSAEDLCIALEDDVRRQPLLDQSALFEAAIDNPTQYGLSDYFYYYLLVRRVMIEAKLLDPQLTEHITLSLVEMARASKMRLLEQKIKFPHFFKIQIDVITRDTRFGSRICVHAYLGHMEMTFEGFLRWLNQDQDSPSSDFSI